MRPDPDRTDAARAILDQISAATGAATAVLCAAGAGAILGRLFLGAL